MKPENLQWPFPAPWNVRTSTAPRSGQTKRIFMTLKEDEQFAVLMLTPEDQSVFIKSPGGAIYPVPNKWGLNGATIVDLKKVKKGLFKDALNCAWTS